MAGPSALALGLLVSFAPAGPALAQAVNLGGLNNIIADGRTQTNVSVNGNTTSITTNTVSQGTGFNSFSDFQQAAGTRVDMYVPDGAGNLVNIVRNGPVVIDGVLNSYKDGAIGGNVFFASSGGFIVGQNGVVNVGSLTVNTPTANFLEHVIRPDGTIDNALASRLMRGEVPISPDGVIAIAGRINASGGVTLQGSSVDISGQILNRNGYQFDQRTLFQSSVNATGLVEGNAMVVRNGVVSIVATNDVRVGGRIDAGSDTGQAGHVSVRAGGDVALESTAELSADGAEGGGLVEVIAGDTLHAWNDAQISARASGAGDGGFVELSGRTVILGAVRADVGAVSGQAGTILIDPRDLYIGTLPGGVTPGPDDSVMGDIVLAGNVILQADNSITLTPNATIDTRTAGVGSGNVVLEAPLITIADHARILAAGDITLDARAATGGLAGFFIGGETRAGIVVGDGAALSGRDISLLVAAEAGAGILPVSVLDAEATIRIGSADITASGSFTAEAVAIARAKTSETNFMASPLGVVTANLVSSITVDGDARITASEATLSARSEADIDITTESIMPDSSPADGAIAVSVIDSRASIDIGGTARFDISGTLALNAENSVKAVAGATPNSAAFGASVAVSVIDALTRVGIGGNAVVNAGALDMAASTVTSARITAKAASGGGGEDAPEEGSQTANYLDQYGDYASTGDADAGGATGGTAVSVVGGLAVSDLTSTTTATVGSGANVTVSGLTGVSAQSSNSAEIVADGSTVEAATGVAAAVGINLASVTSTALVEKLSTGSLAVNAGTPAAGAGNLFSTSATSGAGSTNVGIAGSFAVNLIDTGAYAAIGPSGSVTMTGADRAVTLSANNVTKSTAKALPDGVAGGAGASLGIGGSVALNIVANRSIAEIGADAALSGARDVQLSAEGEFTAETEAAAGSAGGVSLTPALALSLINNTTAARLLSGAALAADGSVGLSAIQRASTTTTASGEAAGSSAAIGAAVAVALVNDVAGATIARNVVAGGAVNLDARGASFSILSAKASATGGASESEDGSDENGVDKLVDANLAAAQDKQTAANVGDADQQSATASGVADGESRSASTSEGGVSVAAAVGVNVQTSHVLASVANGVSISAGGVLKLASVGNTDGQVTSDGSAVSAEGSSGPAVGIGAAVSVNVVSNLNRAVLGAGTHGVGGLEISALRTDVADAANGARTDVFKASATSGAGGSNVGVAGSLALNIIDTESASLIATGATVTLTGGDVALSADNRNTITAEALPHDGGASGGSVGVGASAAINIIANRSSAQLADGAALSGAGDIALTANGAFTIVTKAEAGSKGGVSITPSLALSLINNTTTARLGTGSALSGSGSVGLSAIQQASTTTTASAAAAGENVAIGAAVAVALVNDTVTATTLRNVTAGGDVGFEASGASFSVLTATASAAGGKAADANGDAESGESVDEQVDGQLNFAQTRQDSADVGDADQKSATASGVADGESRSASTSEGGVSVAAAVGVNVQTAHVLASVADGVSISAGGVLKLASVGNTDGQVTSDGSAVATDGSSGSAVGIGAAVSVNVVSNLNRAVLGAGTHGVGGLTISALRTDVADAANGARNDVFKASATSGAGGSNVGVAGSLALNIIDTESAALIATGANVTIGGGDVALSADNRNTITAEALPHDGGASGGTVGVGASAAINIVANRSSGQLADGAALSGAQDVTLSANGAFTVSTKAEAGSKGGVSITPSLALSLINNTTTARFGTGVALGASGSVGLSATQQASTSTTASAVAAGENVAIGAAVAVALVNDIVTATTLRNVTAGGNVAFAANGLSSGTLEARAGASGAAEADDNGEAADGKTVDDGVTDQLSFGGNRQQAAGVGDANQQSQTSAGVADQDGRSAKSEEGKVSVAAAVAVNVAESAVTAAVPASVVISAGGRLSVTSTNTTGATATADASATGSQVGIGSAAAVNAVTKINTAMLLGNGHSANGITVSALQFGGPSAPQADVFAARASSGAGGSKIGIAGALGLNIVNATTAAEIGGNVSAGSGTSEITATSEIEATAEAKPNEQATTGATLGIGASVALNMITTATTANLRDGAGFAGGTGLAVGATSGLSTTTNAAAGASGGVAIDAVVALALIDQTTTARIGTGAGLSMGTGAVSVSALSTGTHIADAVGETKGGKVGVGASAALILGNGASATGQVLANTSVTSASLARNVTAAAVTLSASADRVYLAQATATAGGGKTSQSNADAPAGNASSSNSLDKTKDYQKGTEGGAKVQVAAAVGIAAAQDVATARLEDGVTLTTTGAVDIAASNTTDMVTMGTGAAVDAQASVGVGVGVALGIVNNTTEASVSRDSTIQAGAGGIAVRALSSENALQERVMAAAVAGAASRGVSVAGALAVGISTSSARAFIDDGATVTTSGDVAVSVENTSQLAAKALAGAYSQGGSAGIGASVATAVSEHELVAAIGAGVTVNAADVTVSAINHDIDVAPTIPIDFDNFDIDALADEFKALGDTLMQKPLLGRSNYYVEAIGGAAAPSGVAVQGSFAVMVFDDQVSATIGRSLTGGSAATTTIAATGDVTLEARNDLTAKAVSGGIAVGNSVGVGVSSSVIVSSGTTRALLAGNAVVSGSANFAVAAGASQDIWALGLAAGAASTAGIAGVATVITSQNTVEALVEAGGRVTTGGTADIAAENDFETISVAAGVGAGGTVGIGGAASAVVVENVTRAALGAAARLDANGASRVDARSSVDALTLAAAGAGGGTVGVAAGAAVYVLDATTEALVGDGAEIGLITGTPGSLGVSARDDNELITVSGAMGGGGKVGAGAGAAVGVIGNTVTASIGDNARVIARDVALDANSALTAHTIAIAAGVGGAAGLAGAASVYSVDNTTTARIGSGASVLATNNATVMADEAIDIAFIAGSMAGSGAASIGASASVAVVNSTTQAHIGNNAQVTALALGDAVNYITGYSPDLTQFADPDGAITAPNLSTAGDGGEFEADGGSDGEVLTAVEARRQGLRLLLLDRDAAAVTASARGVIVNATGTTAVRSLAVGGAVSGGVSVSISANVPVITTTVLAGIGTNAQINRMAGTPGTNQSVIVAAASDLYRIGVAGSVAGGTAGIGGGVETAIIRPTTRATIGAGARVDANRDVLVTARAQQDLVGAAAAGAVGVGAAIAGGVSVFALEAETVAEIGSGATVLAQGNAGVIAEDITRSAMVAGSVAIDFAGGGMAGSIGVNMITKRTSASIADNASVTALGLRDAMTARSGESFSGTRDARGVVVYANSNESLFTLGISGAGGAFLAFAGAVSVQLLDIATTASIGNNTLINTVSPASADAGQDVVVVARNSTSIAAVDGGIAVSLGGGIAGAVDVGVLRNTTAASIGNGSTVRARNRIDVAGLQNTDIDSLVISAAGGIVGVAAGVSVYSIGDGISLDGEDAEETRDNVAGTGSYVQGQLGDDTVSRIFAGSDDTRVQTISTQVQAARDTLDVESALSGGALSLPAGTSATIGSATIQAGGTVSVRARDTVGTHTIAGAAAGGLVGLGAGIGIVTVETTNTAQISGPTTITGGGLNLDANSSHTLRAGSAAGSLGLSVAAQAAVAMLTDNSVTRARMMGAQIDTTGTVNINAYARRIGDAQALGAAIGGGGAIGLSLAAVNLDGLVETRLGSAGGVDTRIGTTTSRAGSIAIGATAENLAIAETGAASGGLGIAAAGSVATAEAGTEVSTILDRATLYATGQVRAESEAKSRALADARGIALSGLFSVGGSLADARVGNTVTTTLNQNTIVAGSLALGARTALLGSMSTSAPLLALPGSRRGNFSESATAYAEGSSGAFVGVTATSATADNTTAANLGVTGSTLTVTGAITATAATATAQNATASGLAVGVVAVGANNARARSSTTTQTIFTDTNVTAGALQLAATGSDGNFANATSGSGGLVAGAAAEAMTTSASTTRALIAATGANRSLVQADGDVTLAATHTALFGGKVDSTQASAVGMSSANIGHAVSSAVNAGLSDHVRLYAANLAIGAQNFSHNYFIGGPAYNLYSGSKPTYNSDTSGWNVDSGSGGLVNVPAGSSDVVVNHVTNAGIGANAYVHLLPPTSGVSRLRIEAYNEAIVQQRARLDSGGAIALADTQANVAVNATAAVSLGENTEAIVDVGDIEIAAWGQADLEARAVSTTYGLAGAPSGQAHIAYNGINSVDIARNMRLEVTNGIDPTDGSAPTNGTISVSAGASPVGREAGLWFRTTVDLFNNTAIPIDSRPDAKVTSLVHSNTVIHAATATHSNPAAAYGISAAGDITLRAMGGNVSASAVGIGKNIYLEALSKAASAISNLFGGGDVTFEVRAGSTTIDNLGTATINGLVRTGLQRHKTLTISYSDEQCDVALSSCIAAPVDGEIGYTVSGPVDVGTTILDRLAELRALLAQYGDDPVAAGAYRTEINFLERKLASLGLGHYDETGVFVPGAYVGPSEREILLGEAALIQADIIGTLLGLGQSAGTVVIQDAEEWGLSLQSMFNDATFGIGANAASVRTVIASLGNYATLTRAPTTDNPNPGYSADFVNRYNAINTLVSQGQAAANIVAARVADNETRQAAIDLLTLSIRNAQADLAAAIASGNTADQNTALNAIATAQGSISTHLSAINANNTQIATQSAIASARASTVRSELNWLIDQAATAANSSTVAALRYIDSNPENASNHGAMGKIARGIDGFSYTSGGETYVLQGVTGYNTSLQADVTRSNGRISALSSGIGGTSLSSYVTTITGSTSNHAAKLAEAAAAPNTNTAPKAYVIDVDDVAARLGNVSIIADRLVGSGSLRAPGDAAITITNNTANTLRLGNILIPTYDAGNVRFNGVLVHSNADINRINPAGTSASFNDANIVTASSSSRPLVRIVSNYNPESAAFYDPASALTARNTRHVAPDIILKQGSVLSNLTGAVEIESAAGNIYVNGEILAGSVSILAKNGDFVSSYVNGFDHIGGDPASFNIPTNRGEAGRGIISNGAVSISARYININSTIQSGIAEWTANLNANPILTTNTPTEIGVSQTQLNSAIAAYQTAIEAAYGNPSGVPSMQIDLGNGIILNMAPAGFDPAELQTAVADYLDKIRTNTSADPLYTVSGQRINIKDFLSPSTQGRIEFSIAQAEAYLAANPSAGGMFTVVDPSNNIGVAYDTKNARYVLDGTSVRGGYIQLYGQIMSTGSGQLNVLDGFGTININNASDIPVVLQTLNAGDDALGNGRGTAGIIEITDVIGVDTSTPATPRVDVRFTRYTRDYDPGSPGAAQVMSHSVIGFIDQVTGDIRLASNPGQVVTGANVANLVSGVGAGNRTATYNPTANQRYVWTTGEYFDNTTNFKVKQTQLFGSSSLTISEDTVFDSVDGPHTLDTYRLLDGTYVTTASTATGNAWVVQTNQGIVLVPRDVHTPNGSLADTEYTSSTDAYINESTGPTETGRKRDCNWWTLCIASKVTISYTMNQKYTVITTNSLKADHAIGINFIGSDTGGVAVNSRSDVVLTGNVNASAGTVAIDSSNGSIIQGNLNAQITANTISLNAAGSVGGVTNPFDVAAPANAAVAVRLTGGALTAHAGNGGVSVAARGDLVVNQVSASGNVTVPGNGVVNLSAGGSITGADSSALIQAPRVILSALNGSIGSTANGQQLRVNTGFTTDPALRPFGDPAVTPDLNPYYGLTATAAGDIGITSAAWAGNADGTMLVDQVRSLGGDVRLVSTGYILDNNPIETLDSRTYAQLIDYWESLGLLADDATGGVSGVDGSLNAAKQANAVAGFERSRVQAYNQYWQIRGSQPDGGAAYDPGFSVSVLPGSPQHAALSQQFGAMIRAENPSFTDQQVTDAVAGRISDYEASQTALYHELNGQVGSLTAEYDAHYSYTATSEEVAALTRGATWTERQLAFSLSAGALKTVTSTNPVIKDPNVAGRNVTIEAGLGVGETVGAGTGHVGISIPADIAPSAMTIAQKAALAAAERSDLILNVGQVVLPANATPEQIAAYQAAVALGLDQPGSRVDIQLGVDEGDMSALMRAALDAAAQGLIPASDMTIVVLAKRPLNFDAPESINVEVGGTPDGVSDLGTAHLASRNNAALGTISVFGETRIKVLGSIVNAASGSAVNTGNLILEAAQGGIGTGLNPATGTSYPTLQLNLRPNATFTARAQAGVDVEFAGDALIDTVYSPQDIRLSAPNGSILNANNDLLINILGTNVVLSAQGTIGTGAHALNVGNNLGGGITATANGLINLFGSAGNQFVIHLARSATSSVKLAAALEGIIDGTVMAAGRIDLAAGERLVFSSRGTALAAGDIAIDAGALKMINGAAVTGAGRVAINTANDALVTGVTSNATGAAVTIVAGGRVYGGTAPGRYDITALASGASVTITAGLGIGDKTQANDRWQDGAGDIPGSANAITDIANPLRIRTAAMDLDATQGNIAVVATESAVTVNAHAGDGNIAITAAGRLHGLLLDAAKGSVSVAAEDDILLDEVIAGTDTGASEGRILVVSNNGAVTVGSAASGGSQSYEAENDIVLGTLEAGLGAGAAEGAVDVLTRSGAIDVTTATSGGSQTYEAHGDITFATLTTHGLPTDIGDVALTSTHGAIRGGDIFANGSTYLRGNGVYFGDLVSGENSEITSAGDIIGNSQTAGDTVTDIADGDIRIALVRAPRMTFDAMGALVLDDLRVAESLVLRGGTIDVGITHEPTGPGRLQLTLTGGRGSVGTFATVRVDAPQGLSIPELRFYESEIETTARAVEILEAYVPGSMLLRTPLQTILAENRIPTPVGGNNVQMYQPNFTFNLDLNGFRTFTNAYVVSYDATADVTDILDRLGYDGASLVRDTIRIMYRDGLALDWFAPFHYVEDAPEFELTFDEDGYLVVIDGVEFPVFTLQDAPAVQLSQLGQ